MTELKKPPSVLTGPDDAPDDALLDPMAEEPTADTDEATVDRGLLRKIRDHLPDNFKAEAEGKGIDWVVFSVVAVLALAFVIWGFATDRVLGRVDGFRGGRDAGRRW